MTTSYVWSGSNVTLAVERARVRVLKRSGAIVRGIWRRSIKFRKKKNSSPGNPPFAHTRGRGIRSIYYAYDPARREVVIGPVKHPKGEGAEALEFGGRSRIRLPKSLQRKLGRKTITTRIKARPSGAPTIEKFATKYPDLWRAAVR